MNEMNVNTPLGMLVVKASTDMNNPGVYIDFRQPGCDSDVPVALVEVTSDEADVGGKPILITRIWGDLMLEEYTNRIIHQNIEKYFHNE